MQDGTIISHDTRAASLVQVLAACSPVECAQANAIDVLMNGIQNLRLLIWDLGFVGITEDRTVITVR